MSITQKESQAIGGRITTLISDSGGGTSEWVPVGLGAGVDLVVTGGTAYIEVTSGAPSIATPVATKWPAGTISAGASGTDFVEGASHVRLVATGVAVASVRS